MQNTSSNPEKSLMVSVSGIRGIIPTGLNFQTIINYSLAFAEVLNPKQIILGRDSRPSGEFIEHILTGIFLSLGINVKSAGIVPTPTLKSIVNETKSDGGIMISASHNPLEWNAFKFIGKKGFFFTPAQIDSVKELIVNKNFRSPKYSPKSSFDSSAKDLIQLHIDSVLKRVNVQKIKKKKFKVFVDAVNGGGSFVIPMLLEQLGCKVIRQFCEPDGTFPRPPEPTPNALKKSEKLMKSSGADIGFALDPDADRLVIFTPKKGAVSEEYTLPLSLYSPLQKKKGNIIVNLSSSFISDEVAYRHGSKVLRAKVGEANVVALMLEKKAVFGGEGNGGVIDPSISSFGRDSLAGIAHILNYLAEENTNIDALLSELPAIYMNKTSFSVANKDLNQIFSILKQEYQEAEKNELDGIRFDFGDSWLHVRASNTEPIIRIIAEAKTKDNLSSLLERTKNILES